MTQTTDPAHPLHDVLEVGTMITFEDRGVIRTAEVESRNWFFEKFDSYNILGDLPVYPHQLRRG